MGKINKSFGISNKSIYQRLISATIDRSLGIKLLNRFLKYLSKLLERLFKTQIITFHLRPRFSNDLHIKSSGMESRKSGILMQGPIDHKDNFTIETIKIYKKLYPEVPLVLSTWEDEDATSIDQIKGFGINVITSKKPEFKSLKNSSWKNVDLQMISVKEGIKAISKYDIDYCFKTRTDQRFYKPELFSFFFNLIDSYPVIDDSIQNKRIISSSFATSKYRVYGLTDMMMFAEINDFKRYWNAENYSTGIQKFRSSDDEPIPPIISQTLVGAEVYLMSSYLKEIGLKLNWSLDSYWEILGKYFLITDSNSLDMYWNKYNRESEYKYGRTYEQISHRLIDFSDWLRMFYGDDHLWDTLRSQEKWSRSENGELRREVI